MSDSSTGSELAGELLAFTGESGLVLTRLAGDKLETHGIEAELLASLRAALPAGKTFVDVATVA